MSGVYVSQELAELGYSGTQGLQASQVLVELGYLEVSPGTINVHATQLSTGSSWGLDLEADRLHMERDQFIALEDTPPSYTGSAGRLVLVNDDEDALIFTDTIENLKVEGDLTFEGDGSGLAFGEIWGVDWATGTAIAVTDTWYQVDAFTTNGESHLSTPDYTNHHIVVDHAGRYLIVVSASLVSEGGPQETVFEVEVHLNNGAVHCQNIHADQHSAQDDINSVSMQGIRDLAVNDTVELWVRNRTNTFDVLFHSVCVSLVEVGGT